MEACKFYVCTNQQAGSDDLGRGTLVYGHTIEELAFDFVSLATYYNIR